MHIPKTGGNSINRMFGIEWDKHRDLQAYSRETSSPGSSPDGTVADYFSFAVVRNPWARLYSDYNYQLRKSRGTKLHIYDAEGRGRSFSEWVKAVFDDPFHYEPKEWGGAPSSHIHRWSPQTDWLQIDGEMRIGHVARLEHIRKEIGPVRSYLEHPEMRVPRRNWRLHLPYRFFYKRSLAETVGEYYAADIAAFGYRF